MRFPRIDQFVFILHQAKKLLSLTRHSDACAIIFSQGINNQVQMVSCAISFLNVCPFLHLQDYLSGKFKVDVFCGSILQFKNIFFPWVSNKGTKFSLNTSTMSLCGTKPHTQRIWSTSFRLVVTWLTKRAYIRIYRLYPGGLTYERGGGCLSDMLN